MSVQDVVAQAAAAEQLIWESTCTIRRPGDHGVLNRVTMKYTGSTSAPVYTGACQVRPLRSDRDLERTLGDVTVEVNEFVVKVPIDTPAKRLDVVNVTSSADPGVVGRQLVVKSIPTSEWAPVRRLVCEELA